MQSQVDNKSKKGTTSGKPMVNSPLIRPNFLGVVALGGYP